jgi:hypothetical protein
VQHEVSEGFLRKIGRNYFMILTIDGQRQQRKTGTNDPDKAAELLTEWKAQAKAGVHEDSRLRYEAMRDEYIQAGGKHVQASILRDLDAFFKGMRIAAINVKKLDKFRQWRESMDRVIEYKNETVAKEIELRRKKAGHKKLSADDVLKIESESKLWVENGVKATTNRRLTVLRAMFNFLVARGTIGKNDVPSFPIANNVDNKRRGYLDKQDLPKLLKEISSNLYPFVRFLYATGMRSGQAAKLTWDMVDARCTELHVPGELTTSRSFPGPMGNPSLIRQTSGRNGEQPAINSASACSTNRPRHTGGSGRTTSAGQRAATWSRMEFHRRLPWQYQDTRLIPCSGATPS